jgi:hypothetical protein
MTSGDRAPRRCATKPIPHPSCSWPGSYSPCAAGPPDGRCSGCRVVMVKVRDAIKKTAAPDERGRVCFDRDAQALRRSRDSPYGHRNIIQKLAKSITHGNEHIYAVYGVGCCMHHAGGNPGPSRERQMPGRRQQAIFRPRTARSPRSSLTPSWTAIRHRDPPANP